MRVATLVLLLAATGIAADTEIYRCPLEDGTFAFQGTPCAEPAVDGDDDTQAGTDSEDGEAPAGDDDVVDFVNPFDEPETLPMHSEASRPEPMSANRAECQKKMRDAIDAIDLEMRGRTYTKEQGQAYLADLLKLTRRLRACKQL